jgi:hypothetical protein
MLNQATSSFEHALLVPLTALNGGAVVAFLTLVGAVADRDSRLSASTGWVVAAVVAWAAGLLASALATRFSFARQRAINKGHRALREEIEALTFQGDARLVDALKGPPADRIAEGRKAKRYVIFCDAAWSIGSACFVAGAACAAAAIL